MEAGPRLISCGPEAVQAWDAAWRERQARSGIDWAKNRLGGERKTGAGFVGENGHYAHVMSGMRPGAHSPSAPHSAWSRSVGVPSFLESTEQKLPK